jgi:Zn-dependent protease
MNLESLDPTVFLIFPIVLFSLSVHECAHALVACWGGDDTARLQGRITLNPISHIDPFGTIVVPILLALANMPVLGWARPVQINPSRLKKPIWNVYVTLAGPVSNVLLALIAVLIAKIAGYIVSPTEWNEAASKFVYYFVSINVILAIFNMMPIPPLDGSKVFFHFVVNGRPRLYPIWESMERYSFILLYLFIIMKPVQLFLSWAVIGVLTPMLKFIIS